MSSHILSPGESVTVDGIDFTYEEIKENKIDSVLYRKHLKENMPKH